eukprot:GSA25T00018776001.1
MGSTQTQSGSWSSRCNARGHGAGRGGTSAVQDNGREGAMTGVVLPFRYFVHDFAPFENREELDNALEKGGYLLTNQEKSGMSYCERRRGGRKEGLLSPNTGRSRFGMFLGYPRCGSFSVGLLISMRI